MKPTILIDQDGVFSDFVKGYYAILYRDYPAEICDMFPAQDKLTTFYIGDHFDDPWAKAADAAICNDPSLFSILPPIPGAIEGMKNLLVSAQANECAVFICTAPHKSNPNCYTQKAQWVASHLGADWLDRLIITRDKTVIAGDVLVDDKPNPLGNHIPQWEHVLFTQSYNSNIMNKQRMNDWSQSSIDSLITLAKARYERRTNKPNVFSKDNRAS